MTDHLKGESLGPAADVCAEGVVANVKLRVNVSGRPWAEFDLNTGGVVIPCLCFPRHFDAVADLIQSGRVLRVSGQLSRSDPSELRVLSMSRAAESRRGLGDGISVGSSR